MFLKIYIKNFISFLLAALSKPLGSATKLHFN